MRRLKRPSDANAAQSHQRDPTFVTPPPLYNTFGVKFFILRLCIYLKTQFSPKIA